MDNVISLADFRSRHAPVAEHRPRSRFARATFVFDLMLPQTYLAAERVDRMFSGVRWQPAFAGELWDDGVPAARLKSEAEDRATALGVPLVWPEAWPNQVRPAMRVAALACDLGRGAAFIVGVDLVKDTQVLKKAYNDSQGVTAKFNLNLLARINRELGAKFNPAGFEHHAFFNRDRSRIEMHLASLKRQRIKVCGECIEFRAGETIHTENSYKYSVDSFRALSRGAGWTPTAVWTDADNYFSVHVLTLQG